MTQTLERNCRMPYMQFNWTTHSARTQRLTLEERGLFDLVRCELWTVVGCKMPREALETRLRIGGNPKEAAMLDALLSLGLLQVDGDGAMFDDVQVTEFASAVKRNAENKVNGSKGGRPKRIPEPVPPDASEF